MIGSKVDKGVEVIMEGGDYVLDGVEVDRNSNMNIRNLGSNLANRIKDNGKSVRKKRRMANVPGVGGPGSFRSTAKADLFLVQARQAEE